MLKHTLAGCLVGLLVAVATWSFLPGADAQAAPAPAKRDMGDKAYMGIVYTQNADQSLELTQVYPATPAWDAGLIKGDTILGVEMLQKGKRANELAPCGFLIAGLSTAAPGTEFKMKIHRGQTSLDCEKAFCRDFAKENIEVPAAETFIDHIREAMKDWNSRTELWVTVKTCSFKEFSDFHMREQQIELVHAQILELQTRMVKEEAETQQAYQQIRTLIAQEKLADAQTLLTQVETAEKGFGLAKILLMLLGGIFVF